jgi:hypothetical protein
MLVLVFRGWQDHRRVVPLLQYQNQSQMATEKVTALFQHLVEASRGMLLELIDLLARR